MTAQPIRSTIPPPSQSPKQTVYRYTNRSGAAPVTIEWHELSSQAQSIPTCSIPGQHMSGDIALGFEIMERRKWTRAGNDQVELEIRR